MGFSPEEPSPEHDIVAAVDVGLLQRFQSLCFPGHDFVDAEACQRLRATIEEHLFLNVAPSDEVIGDVLPDR